MRRAWARLAIDDDRDMGLVRHGRGCPGIDPADANPVVDGTVDDDVLRKTLRVANAEPPQPGELDGLLDHLRDFVDSLGARGAAGISEEHLRAYLVGISLHLILHRIAHTEDLRLLDLAMLLARLGILILALLAAVSKFCTEHHSLLEW